MVAQYKLAVAVATVAGTLAVSSPNAQAGLGVTIDNCLKSGGQTAPYSYGFQFNVTSPVTISALDLALQTSPTLNVRLYKYNSVSQIITQLATADVVQTDPTVVYSGQVPEGGTVPQLGSPSSGPVTMYQHFLDAPITISPEANTTYYVAGDLPLGNWIYNQARVDQLHTAPGVVYQHSVSSRGEFGDNPIYDYLSSNSTVFRAGWNTNFSVAVVGHWTGVTNSDWSTSSNWTGSVPNGTGDVAFFDAVSTPNPTVNLATAKTVGTMNFASAVHHEIAGTGPLTLDGGGATATVSVTLGNHTISTPVVLTDNLSVATAASTSIAFTGNVSAAGKSLTKSGAGTLQFANLRGAGATVTGGTLQINQKGTSNADVGTSTVTSLSISPGATVDLTNNSLIVDYAAGSGATTTNDLRVALKDGLLGTTNGQSGAFKIGYVDNATYASPLGSFGGQTVDASSVLLKFTRNGDATLDGTVNFDDLVVLAQNYNLTNMVWAQGDNTYDAVVNFDDLVALAQNYNLSLSLAQQAAVSSDFASDYALALSLVPEPTSMVASLGLAIVGLRRRRGV